MNLLKSLINHLRNKEDVQKGEPPAGYCPNCWGKQEYGGNFYEVAKNQDADINSNNPQLGWIQEYANKHLSGIALQAHGDKVVCQNCKLNYAPEK